MRCPTIDPIRWLSAPELVDNGFPLSVIEPTGEIQRKERRATYRGLTFKVAPSLVDGLRLSCSGSIHKYHNNGQHNGNRFRLIDVSTCINDLSKRFGIDPERTPIEGMEIGVNLSLPFDPSRVIRSAIAYKGQPYHTLNTRRTSLTGKACSLTDYEIKLYDKGKQMGDPRANLLRVEVKVNRIRPLLPYGVATLADLTNPAKAARLVEVLLSVIADTVFIDPTANTDLLTPPERETLLRLQIPDQWNGKNLTRRMRTYYRQHLPQLLEKCNAFDYGRALHKCTLAEWQTLCSEGQNQPDLQPSEAVGNVTFSTLEYVAESVTSTLKRDSIYFLAENSENRVCLSCGKPLTGQRSNSRFCSEKYNPTKAARQCRNRNSNPRRTKRNQIMKAKERNQFLRITYTANGHTYTDTLHSSEVAVSREYLDSVVSVEVLPECPNANQSGTDCYGHCRCVTDPATLTGPDARQRLADLTNQNAPISPDEETRVPTNTETNT